MMSGQAGAYVPQEHHLNVEALWDTVRAEAERFSVSYLLKSPSTNLPAKIPLLSAEGRTVLGQSATLLHHSSQLVGQNIGLCSL